jgi:hypothetical protein
MSFKKCGHRTIYARIPSVWTLSHNIVCHIILYLPGSFDDKCIWVASVWVRCNACVELTGETFAFLGKHEIVGNKNSLGNALFTLEKLAGHACQVRDSICRSKWKNLPDNDRWTALISRPAWDAHRTKNGRPNSGEKGKLFSSISLSILIYLKRNSFNSHY